VQKPPSTAKEQLNEPGNLCKPKLVEKVWLLLEWSRALIGGALVLGMPFNGTQELCK
jgi:hypothetical protein